MKCTKIKIKTCFLEALLRDPTVPKERVLSWPLSFVGHRPFRSYPSFHSWAQEVRGTKNFLDRGKHGLGSYVTPQTQGLMYLEANSLPRGRALLPAVSLHSHTIPWRKPGPHILLTLRWGGLPSSFHSWVLLHKSVPNFQFSLPHFKHRSTAGTSALFICTPHNRHHPSVWVSLQGRPPSDPTGSAQASNWPSALRPAWCEWLFSLKQDCLFCLLLQALCRSVLLLHDATFWPPSLISSLTRWQA